MSQPFGNTPEGQPARLFTLRNASGFGVDVTDFGGAVVNLFAPDRHGQLGDVVLGFDDVAGYATLSPYFGALIGRYGNRIAAGRFTLDGQTHTLPANNTPGGIPCHLHGGPKGFDKVMWRAEPVASDHGSALRLHYTSVDGEAGYPGTLETSVLYTVTDDNTLRIDYEALTGAPTIVNLTNHSYFNLAGEGSRDVLDHVLTINAPAYTPVNAGLIPTGEIASVAGTPFDFVSPHRIGERIAVPHEQLRFAGGYDHNFVLARGSDPHALVLAASVFEPSSGRVLEVLTTEPGLQFYSGNFLDGSFAAKHGHVYAHRTGFCLETQHFPDSPNQPAFPSTVLRPGETRRSTTVYRFRIR